MNVKVVISCWYPSWLPPCVASCVAGMFTAPVDGLYFFAFTTCADRLGQVMVGVQLIRNNEEVSFAAQFMKSKDDWMSNSAALVLKQGDLVYVRLPRGSQVSSSVRHMSNTFSGFLIHELWEGGGANCMAKRLPSQCPRQSQKYLNDGIKKCKLQR